MKSNADIKQRAMGSALWKFADKIGSQVIQFIIQIFLARLLFPEDYGIVGLLTIFINISDVFIQQGFTTALIQKQDADETDFSSVFFANILMAVLIYLIFFSIAPLVAKFYEEPKLTSLMRVLSLNVIFGAIGAVHNAVMVKNLEFKKSFYRGMTNTLTYGIVGIALAFMGFGVWALVFSKIAGTLVGSLVLCLTVKWKPKKLFSGKRIRKLFSFSSKILGTNLLNTVFNNIHSLIIGKFFQKDELGYYQKGQQIPQTFMTAIDGSLNEVLYPTLSIVQNDMVMLKAMLRRSMKLSMYVVLPILVGLLVVAEPFVVILLTDKWLPCVPYLRLTCIMCMFWPLSARNHALNAMGKSTVTFITSIIGKSITLIMIFVCIRWGIYAIMLGSILASCISFFITSALAKKYIGYSFRELFRDLLPSIGLSVLMGVPVYLMSLLPINVYFLLVLQVLAGVAIYLGASVLFKVDSFKFLLGYVKKILKKREAK